MATQITARKPHSWHSTPLGVLLIMAIELGAAYGLGSLAIDRGNLWLYGATFVLLILALHGFARIIRRGR